MQPYCRPQDNYGWKAAWLVHIRTPFSGVHVIPELEGKGVRYKSGRASEPLGSNRRATCGQVGQANPLRRRPSRFREVSADGAGSSVIRLSTESGQAQFWSTAVSRARASGS